MYIVIRNHPKLYTIFLNLWLDVPLINVINAPCCAWHYDTYLVPVRKDWSDSAVAAYCTLLRHAHHMPLHSTQSCWVDSSSYHQVPFHSISIIAWRIFRSLTFSVGSKCRQEPTLFAELFFQSRTKSLARRLLFRWHYCHRERGKRRGFSPGAVRVAVNIGLCCRLVHLASVQKALLANILNTKSLACWPV